MNWHFWHHSLFPEEAVWPSWRWCVTQEKMTNWGRNLTQQNILGHVPNADLMVSISVVYLMWRVHRNDIDRVLHPGITLEYCCNVVLLLWCSALRSQWIRLNTKSRDCWSFPYLEMFDLVVTWPETTEMFWSSHYLWQLGWTADWYFVHQTALFDV